MHIHHIIVNLPDRTTELTCGFKARQQVLVYGSMVGSTGQQENF